MNTRPSILVAGATAACLTLAAPSAAQVIERVSVSTAGVESNGYSTFPSLSADGSRVAFASWATNLVANDTNGVGDVFLRDRIAGTTRRVSVSSGGAEGNGSCTSQIQISANGQHVAFFSVATNLVAGDTNGRQDLFVHQVSTGTTTRVSVSSAGTQGDRDASGQPAISSDGNLVAFRSDATNLVPGDNNGLGDIFLRDRSAGTTTRVSVSTAGAEANGTSRGPVMSGDGRYVVFESHASNLVAGDTNSKMDVFVHDRLASTTTRVSVSGGGAQGNDKSWGPVISGNGRYIGFQTWASNLIPAGVSGPMVVDTTTGAITRVDVSTRGELAIRRGGIAGLSDDGQVMVMFCNTDNFSHGGSIFTLEPYIRRLQRGVTSRANVSATGEPSNSLAYWVNISGDGDWVAFSDVGTNLVAGDTNGVEDIFVRGAYPPDWLNYGTGLRGTYSIPSLTVRSSAILGSTLEIDASNSLGSATLGLMVFGFNDATTPLLGATLYVVPAEAWVVSLVSGGYRQGILIPNLPAFLSWPSYFQILELDAGAANGVSFSKGLLVVTGR